MSLNGAGRFVDIEQSACPRCCGVVWCVRGERANPLYENEDGTAHALTCVARVKTATLVVKPKKGSTPP